MQQCPRQTQPKGLPGIQRLAMLAEHRLETLRQLGDEVLRVDELRGFAEVLQREADITATEVLRHGAGEERIHAADEDRLGPQ